MDNTKQKLIDAEKIAATLFQEIEQRHLIVAGKSEKEINEEIFQLADEIFGIKKYWHKRIVRAGENTLRPYDENPPDLIVQPDDILFFDFGPIVEEWEADYGRTYVLGNDAEKRKLKNDIEIAWHETKQWFDAQTKVTGSELFAYAVASAKKNNWSFGGEIAGHLIGRVPHEKLEKGNVSLYIHKDNPNDMRLPDANGNARDWILEMHFVNRVKKFGGFFEQLLT